MLFVVNVMHVLFLDNWRIFNYVSLAQLFFLSKLQAYFLTQFLNFYYMHIAVFFSLIIHSYSKHFRALIFNFLYYVRCMWDLSWNELTDKQKKQLWQTRCLRNQDSFVKGVFDRKKETSILRPLSVKTNFFGFYQKKNYRI
jgi:hypothetical protein